MNLYKNQVAHDEDRTQKLILKLDWLGTESKPHFLCTVEHHETGKLTPSLISLFMISGMYSTECVQIISRLGRALVLEGQKEGLAAVLARLRAYQVAWMEAEVYTILGQVTSFELERIIKHRP